MEECIFCKIINGKIPCYKIWEDEKYISFLDIFPMTEGMTLVVPKKHQPSYIFKNSDEDISDIMKAAKKVSLMLEKVLNVDRVSVVFEGIEVEHLHVKLFPIRKGDNLRVFMNSDPKVYDSKKLEELAKEIREAQIN